MSEALIPLYFTSYLEPLSPWLERDDLTDIWINRPGEIWVETLGGEISREEVTALDRQTLARLARQIASWSSQGISREHPLLAANLPDGSRVQVILPPATRGEIAIAIRRHVVADLQLDHYRVDDRRPLAATAAIATNDYASSGSDPVDVLRRAVRARRNILVSGGTSTGKTTLINALIQEIPTDERLIYIEDTPELAVHHANMVGLVAARGRMGEAAVTAEDLLIASLRMRPDRIILGEVRGSEAATFLRAINSGHPGSMTSIHADTPERAIDQLALLISGGGTSLRWEEVERHVRRSVDVVVQLGRIGGKRSIIALCERSGRPNNSLA